MRKRLLAVFLELSILLSILLIAVIHGGAVISFITLLIGAINFPVSLGLAGVAIDDLEDVLYKLGNAADYAGLIVIVFLTIGFVWAFFYFPINKFIGFVDTLG